MNLLYSAEESKNIWGYDSDVGFIPKGSGGSDYDAKQDQEIEANREHINRNDARDDEQQGLIDSNYALDAAQQEQIDANTSGLAANNLRDDEQQRLIEQNQTNIINVQNELPTLNVDNTTLVIGKKGDA